MNARGVTAFVHVDVTGLGRPISHLLREGLEGFSYYLSAVTITTGTALRPMGMGAAEISVGKEHLVSLLQVLLDHGRILLPTTRSPERSCGSFRTSSYALPGRRG
jgi:hypothetical protein